MLLTKEKWIIPWRKFKTASHTFYGSTQVKQEVHLVYIPKLQTSRVTQGNTILKQKQNKMWLLFRVYMTSICCATEKDTGYDRSHLHMARWAIDLSDRVLWCYARERKQPELYPGWSSTGAVVLLRIEYIPNKTKLPAWHFKEWLCSFIL